MVVVMEDENWKVEELMFLVGSDLFFGSILVKDLLMIFMVLMICLVRRC